jgi:tyrosine-protein kinase Etk/Wzc
MSQDFESGNRNEGIESASQSPKELLYSYLPILPWIIGMSALCLFIAGMSLRYAQRLYNVTGIIYVMEPANGAGQQASIEKLLFNSPRKDINDEIVLIRSTNIASRVVDQLDLGVKYMNIGSFRNTNIRESDCPFNLEVIKLSDTTSSFSFYISIVGDDKFKLDESEKVILKYDQVFTNSHGTFRLIRGAGDIVEFTSNRFEIIFFNKNIVARQLSTYMNVEQLGESENILKLSMETENPKLGIDIVNQWMNEYLISGLEEKKEVASNTVKFIDDQLSTVQKDLSSVEGNLLNLREKNRLISPKQQSEQMFTTVTSLESELTQKGVELQIVDNLINYISDNRSPYRQVASTLGISEPSLVYQMAEFNKLQVERETMLKTTSRTNPAVVNLEATIEKLRVDIQQNLLNIKKALRLGYDNLSARRSVINSEVSQIPSKERDLLDITRRQKILEELYSFLLQKKLETSIASASSIPSGRIVEPAVSTDYPIKPKKAVWYLSALLIGVFIPLLITFIREYLNDKVRNKADISRATKTPIIGEISNSSLKETLVVNSTTRSLVAEQFRIIRTNLPFFVSKQNKYVILTTSSISGEGKSFISTNLASAMAIAGKKTVILEFDIRKPKILSGLNMSNGLGITNYVIGTATYESIIQAVPDVPNLFVVPCGTVPPNPSEVLLNDKLSEFIECIKNDFDVAVIDTAPIGLVSDALILSKHSDMTLFVVRQNHTLRKQLVNLDEMYRQERLPKMAIILNDVSNRGGYGGYSYTMGYGTYDAGKGYSSESDYFENPRAKGSLMGRLLHLFRSKSQKGRST